MSSFEKQLEAIGTALLMVQKLPEKTIWGLHCTNSDDAESPSTLNIYIPRGSWYTMHALLRLGNSVDSQMGEMKYVSYRKGQLLISFIEE